MCRDAESARLSEQLGKLKNKNEKLKQINMKSTIPHFIHAFGQDNPNDRLKNCVVRALTVLTNVDYRDIEEYLTPKYGYSSNKGVNFLAVLRGENNNIFGKEFIPIPFRGTLAQFASEYKYNIYAVMVSRHIFVVSFGKVIDSWIQKDGRRIKGVWQVS